MESKPFWETAYSDLKVSAFSKGSTANVEDHFRIFPSNAAVLDVGCGEGRNSVFMTKLDIEETKGAINFYVDCVNNKHLPYVLAAELKETCVLKKMAISLLEKNLGQKMTLDEEYEDPNGRYWL